MHVLTTVLKPYPQQYYVSAAEFVFNCIDMSDTGICARLASASWPGAKFNKLKDLVGPSL